MTQAGKAHGQRRLQPGRHVQHHFQMHAGIDFRVVLGALRHTVQGRHFGQDALQCTAGTQFLQHARRALLQQAAADFLPDALRHQVIGLAVLHHLLHQCQRFRGGVEIAEACGKARQAQNAYRILAKGIGHMAQHALLQVALALERIGQAAVFGPGDGVDGQVAARQVFFQGHAGIGMDGKALVAARGFAFGARQCVFLVRVRVQEHRKILAHRHKAVRHHQLRRGPDDNPVVVLHRQAEQGIAHGTTHHVDAGTGQAGKGGYGSGHDGKRQVLRVTAHGGPECPSVSCSAFCHWSPHEQYRYPRR